VSYAGISFEAEMTAEQAAELARLMEQARPTRPEGVVTALLEYTGGRGRLLAVWRDAETLDRYLAEADVPRGVELMRKLGLEPEVRRFDVLDLG
jgi:hypothetical protein